MNARAGVILAVRTLVVGSLALIPAPVIAAPLILNGGFENGFASWDVVNQSLSDGTFFIQTGTSSPSFGFPVPAPPGGMNAAMTDGGASSSVLFQEFVVPTGLTAALLSFDLFINNQASDFFVPSPPTLNFNLPPQFPPNQQARVDVLLPSNDPFSVAAADVLQTLYQTNPGDPLTAGYFTNTFDLTSLLAAHDGQTLRLRFAEVDNVSFFNLGVDRVSLEVTTTTPIPEPASFALLGVGALALIARRHHSRRA